MKGRYYVPHLVYEKIKVEEKNAFSKMALPVVTDQKFELRSDSTMHFLLWPAAPILYNRIHNPMVSCLANIQTNV